MLHERLVYIILLYTPQYVTPIPGIRACMHITYIILCSVRDDQILCEVEVRHVRTWPSDVEYII